MLEGNWTFQEPCYDRPDGTTVLPVAAGTLTAAGIAKGPWPCWPSLTLQAIGRRRA